MPVRNTKSIDRVTHNPKTHELILIMVEDREKYDVDRQLLELQEKINTYVHYAMDGQLAKDYPEWAGRPVTIQVDYHFPPNPEEIQFLEEVEKQLKAHKIKFTSTLIEAKGEWNRRS